MPQAPTVCLPESQLDLFDGFSPAGKGRAHVWLAIEAKDSFPKYWVSTPQELTGKFITPHVRGKLHCLQDGVPKEYGMIKGAEICIQPNTPFYFEADEGEKFTVILYTEENWDRSKAQLIPIE